MAEVVPAVPVESPLEVMNRILQVGSRWLGETDAATVAILRQCLEEREAVRPLALAGNSAARKELRELDKQALSILSQLGFDPTSRARLGVAEVKVASTLETLKKKRG